MSYWSHNPELLDEITIKALPEKWRKKMEAEEIELSDVPRDIYDKAILVGEREYWAGLGDERKERRKL